MTIPKQEKKLIEIPLHFENKIYVNVFKDKNNKTLKETLNSPKYKQLKNIIVKNYPNELNTPLGDFIIKLKNTNNIFYKNFLNKYWDLEYSKFYIKDDKHYNLKGIYFYYLNNELKYIGRCKDNMKKRINNWYGKISPKNCFIDGQSTNCRLNNLITDFSKNIKLKLFVINNNSEIEYIEKELINRLKPIWNKK